MCLLTRRRHVPSTTEFNNPNTNPSPLTALLSCQEFIDFWVVTCFFGHGVKNLAGLVVLLVYVPVVPVSCIAVMISRPILRDVGFDNQLKAESYRL